MLLQIVSLKSMAFCGFNTKKVLFFKEMKREMLIFAIK